MHQYAVQSGGTNRARATHGSSPPFPQRVRLAEWMVNSSCFLGALPPFLELAPCLQLELGNPEQSNTCGRHVERLDRGDMRGLMAMIVVGWFYGGGRALGVP